MWLNIKKNLRRKKNILLYLIEFLADGSIILMDYLEDYEVNILNIWPIIMITYNKNTFLANNN